MPDGRPEIERRPDYLPKSPHGEFIVLLLRVAIEVQIDRLLSPGQSKNAPRVLDAGCRAQPFRARIEKTGASYYSLDVCAQAGVKVDFVAPMDEKHLSESIYHSGPYDLILCSEVLEHVAEWDNVFANFYQLSAPSGHIILYCPHFFPLHEEPYDFWRPSPYAIRYFAQKHGFTIETETALGTGRDVLGTLLACQSFLPRTRSFALHFVNRMCQVMKRWLFALLRSGRLQDSVVDRGPFYLANVFVLRKADT
jgi:SAM-dependent methyltransferase